MPLATLLRWRAPRHRFMLLLLEKTTLRAQVCKCPAALAQCATLCSLALPQITTFPT